MNMRLWVLTTLVLLNGCALAPGMDKAQMYPDTGEYHGIEVNTFEIDAKQIIKTFKSLPDPVDNPEVTEDIYHEYYIAPQDVLAITVWDHPELTTPAGANPPPELLGSMVRNDGTIFYPHAGILHVAGKSVEQVRLQLSKKLKLYIEDPQVDVRVASYRSQIIYVTGEVTSPKTLPFTNSVMRVLDAINLAGGPKQTADISRVKLTHKDGSIEVVNLARLQFQGKLSENKILRPGDQLFVPDNQELKVFVTGEVNQAGAFPMEYFDYSLGDAIADAGGLNMETSSPAHIYVIRGVAAEAGSTNGIDGINVYHLDAESPEGMIMADSFMLHAKDVVFVSTAGVIRWGRVLNNFSSTIQALSVFRIMGLKF